MISARTLMVRSLSFLPAIPSDSGERPDPREFRAYAHLMLDAYRGSVDDEGESIDDAIEVMKSLFTGGFGEYVPDASSVVLLDGVPVAATFVTIHDGLPLVAFSMTSPRSTREGHARTGLHHAYGALAAAGHSEVRLVVTDGNVPAVTLYVSEGFVAV